MSQSFPSEFSFISILTAIAFFVVSVFVFKSISVSALLVAVIQSAVFITMAVLVLQTDAAGVGFLSLIIAQVLLKSRVIDYGILYASNYIEARKDNEAKQATIQALENSIETIVTSGLIITLIMLVSGLIFLPINGSIAEIFLVIAQGCFIGILLSVFVLPSLIAVFDRFVSKARSTGGH
jgi:predicted RND superfamily exporter protein